MSYSAILPKALLIFLYCCFCSFSAVPVAPNPPQKTVPSKNKRQLRLQKRLQRKQLKAQKRLLKRLDQPKKNHATLNILGFCLIIGAPIILTLSIIIMLLTIGIYVPIILIILIFAIPIAIAVAGTILCILGLIGHKQAERPRIGFAIAGLIIIGIPILVALVVLFIILGRFAGFLA